MAVHILHDDNQAVFYCSTSGWAFGPVFVSQGIHDADERAEAFLRWLEDTDAWVSFAKEPLWDGRRRDPRVLTDRGLSDAYGAWLAQEADQWAREDAAQFAEEEQ
jgi:hypothetical protein